MKNKNFDAVIFDLDGVITKTADVHSRAWKRMFDEFLMQYAEKNNLPFKEFTHESDYLPFVDGKPRYKGVASFLESRSIDIPFGEASDDPAMETVCGLGNRKNEKFHETLQAEGVDVFPSTVALIKQLKEEGYHIGVASSSKNCEVVLKAAGLLELFETRVDGVVSVELNLKGKPESDIFTTAADNMGVTYYRSVIVEDAVSGVQAGRNGRFGLVLGIARENNHAELKKNGADVVVSDLEEMPLESISKWFEEGIYRKQWTVEYQGYNPENERTHEALLTVGNGYFGTRGALEEQDANDTNYPGTYIAGLYNRLKTPISGRDIENEDFVNAPDWTSIKFKIDEEDWFIVDEKSIVSMERILDLKTGMLQKDMIVKDAKGRETKIISKRFASMKNMHLGAVKYGVIPVNYDGKISLTTGLKGDIINDGVKRYRDLNQQHLAPVSTFVDGNIQSLTVTTTESNIEITETAKIKAFKQEQVINPAFCYEEKPGMVYTTISQDLQAGECFSIEKTVAIYTSKDDVVSDLQKTAMEELTAAPDFETLFSESKSEWQKLWNEMDIVVEGDRQSQNLLRLHMYHLSVSASIHNTKLDAGITARGLHGEAYRGHIFWDELYILPFYFIHFPEVAKALLMYRCTRLDEARKLAKEYNYEGAMFPWQSGSNGREETQTLHLNPISGEWGSDHSSLQRHVSLAIAFNIWQYFHHTNDVKFIEKHGAEVFLEICRFWASKSEYIADDEKYHIDKVMGPDEFHEKYPDKEEGGLRDNAYTNIMSVWSFRKAFEMLDAIDENVKAALLQKLHLTHDELARWKDIEQNMKVVIEDDIIAQYDGYFELEELDWDSYREKYSNIYRMDRILKAEGKSADDYKVAKQADTLMTFYNLSEEEVTGILKDLGYEMSADYLAKNLKYYLQRTSHGSTLSRVVHSQLASMSGNEELSWEMYQDALASDFNDIQGGTTGEGIHSGVMAGTVMIALSTYAGLNLKGDLLQLKPNLPPMWTKMKFHTQFKEISYSFDISKESLKVKADGNTAILFNATKVDLSANQWVELSI